MLGSRFREGNRTRYLKSTSGYVQTQDECAHAYTHAHPYTQVAMESYYFISIKADDLNGIAVLIPIVVC